MTGPQVVHEPLPAGRAGRPPEQPSHLSATEVARHFSTVIDEAEHGETILVPQGGWCVATTSPAPACPGQEVKELLRRHHPDPAWTEDLRAMRETVVDSVRPWPDA
ncbi:MAG TPA: hypothetical protein VFX70_19560 [Mycobacteriales bacterium]|nr:hypothetical protein [Mycobacteriales bacterium]